MFSLQGRFVIFTYASKVSVSLFDFLDSNLLYS